jgi:PPOX class probable F420-dependent enzyme
MSLPAGAVDRILETWPVARLATLDAGGSPHLVPVVFARSAGALWSAVDAKPKSSVAIARVRYLRRDPRAALLLDHYDADWSALWWIRVDATADVIEPRARDGEIAAALDALRRKYPQYERTAVVAPGAPVLRFRIDRLTSWCADPTRHA